MRAAVVLLLFALSAIVVAGYDQREYERRGRDRYRQESDEDDRDSHPDDSDEDSHPAESHESRESHESGEDHRGHKSRDSHESRESGENRKGHKGRDSHESRESDESHESREDRDDSHGDSEEKKREFRRYQEKRYREHQQKYGDRHHPSQPYRYERSAEFEESDENLAGDPNRYYPGGDDEYITYRKRSLQHYVEKDDDGFFDDVKEYYRRDERYPSQAPERSNQVPHDRYAPEVYQMRPDTAGYYSNREHRYRAPERYQPPPSTPRVQGEIPTPPPQRQRPHSWKQDRVRWSKLPPVVIAPPEMPHKDFVPTAERSEPPPPSEAAKMARYIVHNSDWTTVATHSTLPKIRNYPFVNVLSVSDGPVGDGSGIPYLFMTELDLTPHDLAVDRRCSLSMTLAETDYCKQQKLDPEDPRCAHVALTGEMWKLKNGTQAAKIAEEALFTRHPSMKNWPKDHNFFFATLKIEQIVLLDYFGGPKFVSVRDYLRATPPSA